MPVYEYKCKNCGRRFENREDFDKSKNEVQCPKCRSGDTSRIYSFSISNPLGSSCGPIKST